MNKPDVRIIEPQFEESKEVQTTDWEKQQLLAKYGFSSINTNNINNKPQEKGGFTFEEMIAIEERRLEEERIRKNQPRPNSYTIDPNYVQYTEEKYSGDGDLGFRVQIVSDMKF